jgi:hypothetical protein
LDAGAEACFQFAWSAGRDRKNLPLVKPIIIDLVGITLGFVALYLFSAAGSKRLRDLIEGWPLWLVGLAGMLMYTTIHVEARYSGAFLVPFWLGGLRFHWGHGTSIRSIRGNVVRNRSVSVDSCGMDSIYA